MESNEAAFFGWMAGCFLLCFCAFGWLERKRKKGCRLAGTALLLAAVFGLAGAKLIYYLCQIDFMIAAGWQETLLRIVPEELSFYGGAAGVCLGIALAARLRGLRPVQELNEFAPFGLALGGLIRFGEFFLGMHGVGPYLDNPSLCFFPLARGFSWGGDWTEWYLAVFMLEGISLLILAVLSGTFRKEHRFLRSLFYFCLPQILLENLRLGSFMWFFCIRVEQLACMVCMFAILMLYGARAGRGIRGYLPAGVSLLCAGLFIACEFAMEGKIPFLRFLTAGDCYGIMAAGLVILALAEIRGFRMAYGREERSGQV